MEEKKFDPYQFIGFVLIAMILTWMLYRNSPEEGVVADPETTTKITPAITPVAPVVSDSIQNLNLSNTFGDFAQLLFKNDVENVRFENTKLALEIAPKGGLIKTLNLKEFTNYEQAPLNLVAEDNSEFNIQFTIADGRVLNSKDFYFTPRLEQRSTDQQLTLTANVSKQQYIAFVYTLPEDGYQLDFEIKTVGIARLLNANAPPQLEWESNTFRNSRSIDYEGRYTELTYGYDGDRVDYLSLSGTDEETVSNIRWISFRQHFFSAIMIPQAPLNDVTLQSESLADDESLEQKFTKHFTTAFKLPYNGGDINQKFTFYYGPTDYQTLKELEGDLEASIPLGWGIFGWINRFVFLPLFAFLSSFLPFGVAIIVMTIIVRLAMSPVTYKSYVSQIKMKVLRPDVDAINAKYKDNAAKRQQETMSLYNRAGANPMSGCVPALIQLPVFYALFSFFPVAFVLREKSFLWADDLSSYDSVLDLPFSIPFYGDHVSLFPILASVAIFFYTRMTTGQQPMPQQPGMPNMKIIMYLMPLMMLFFFNNYASGLSLYYFVSNLLTIFLMLVIKNYIIDDAKIHAKIEENKKKPKKAGGFSARLQKAMEEAEKQKAAKKRKG
ncbi:membrane protein insertase YidC [Flavobacteriaceae bacterium]|nr:membrane protein insertase YidC [Flavobacteriaceae bacterium]